jgi:pimeloyl-ACP methyl ester carboxylesterase
MKKWLKRIGWSFLAILIGWIIYAQVAMKFRISDSEAKKKFAEKGVQLFTETINANGSDLHYAKTGSDTLPTLFFVHGSPGGWIKFMRYMYDKDLLKKYRMVSVDRPGFGYSEFGNVKSLQEQSNIISVLLKKIQNGKPMYAAGRSYGGPMIVKLAVDNPGMFDGLVLIAAALDPAAEKPEKWRPILYKSPLKYLLPGAWRPSNQELWHLKKELKELDDHYDEITCDVVILHGDKDGLVPVSNAEYSKKMLINAKSISMTIIPGANHFVSDNKYELVKDVFMKMDSYQIKDNN